MPALRERILEQEMLDTVGDEEAAFNLNDIARINRLTGARGELLRQLKSRFNANDSFHFLDVGAASGDLARAVQNTFPRAKIYCLDLQYRNLAHAPNYKVQADAFLLPFSSNAIEVVHCSLFLHHFSIEQTQALVLEMWRVSSNLVLIQDLHRHWLAYYFLPATKLLLNWGSITVEDGMKSVAAGWRREELQELLDRIELGKYSTISWHFPSFRYFIAISDTA